jgi:hypothetical protein
MSIKLVDDAKLTAIGNSIRSKGGTSALLTLDQMPQAIASLPSGGADTLNTMLANNLTEFESATGVTSLQQYLFYNKTSLETVSLPNVTALEQYCLYRCTGLTSLSVPNVQSVATFALAQCSGLTSLTLPGLTGAVASHAIRDCANLARVDMYAPTQLGGNAFALDTALLVLIIRRTDAITTLQNSGVFANSAIVKGEGYVYVPSALVDTYKAATNWTAIASKIRAIEDYPDICDPS